MLVDITSVSRVWAVVTLMPRMAASTEVQLAGQGIECFVPWFKRRASDKHIRALFPGYVFLRISPALELATVRSFPGIRRPLVFRAQLACIEDEVVEEWQARQAGKGYSLPAPTSAFTIGQQVRIREGAFMGLTGVVLEELPARQRVRLLLEHLGTCLQVIIDSDIVK